MYICECILVVLSVVGVGSCRLAACAAVVLLLISSNSVRGKEEKNRGTHKNSTDENLRRPEEGAKLVGRFNRNRNLFKNVLFLGIITILIVPAQAKMMMAIRNICQIHAAWILLHCQWVRNMSNAGKFCLPVQYTRGGIHKMIHLKRDQSKDKPAGRALLFVGNTEMVS